MTIIVYNNCRFYFIMEVLLESLKLGIVPSLVVLIYLVFNKILESKSKVKQVEFTNNIVESFNKLNNFLDYFTKNIINKEIDKCDLGIRHSFDKLKSSLLDFAIITIINNNVNINKENIIDNINHLINGEYYVLINNLGLYTTHNINISNYVSEDWKVELYEDMVSIIFNKDFDKEQKIYSISNKLNTRINEYKNIILTIQSKDDSYKIK